MAQELTSKERAQFGRSQSMRIAGSVNNCLKRMVPEFASMRLPANSKRIWSVFDGPTITRMPPTNLHIGVEDLKDSGSIHNRRDEVDAVATQRW